MTHRPHSIQAWLVNWLSGTVLVAIFFGLVYLAEQDASLVHELAALERQAQLAEVRMLQGATALCEAEHGPGARAGLTPGGDVVCVPAAEQPAVTVAEVRP